MTVNNKTILITGGAGFIGSHVVRLFVTKYPEYRIINLDKLTYAGNLENLKDIEHLPNYEFIKGDIVDGEFIHQLLIKSGLTRSYTLQLNHMSTEVSPIQWNS